MADCNDLSVSIHGCLIDNNVDIIVYSSAGRADYKTPNYDDVHLQQFLPHDAMLAVAR